MTYDFDDLQNADVVIGAAGLAGTGITDGEKTGLISDVEDLKDHTLLQHPDVYVDTFVEEGFVLSFDPDAGGPSIEGWVPRTPANNQVAVTGTPDDIPAAIGLAFANPLRVDELVGYAVIDVNFGTTADTIAEGNHSHSQTLKQTIRANGLANVTTGVPLLVTNTIGPLTNGVVYDIDALAWCEGFSTLGGFSQAQLRLTIAGNAVTTPTLTYEGGVDGPKLESHELTVVGTGAVVAITLHMVWVSGSIKPVACAVKVVADPRR